MVKHFNLNAVKYTVTYFEVHVIDIDCVMVNNACHTLTINILLLSIQYCTKDVSD